MDKLRKSALTVTNLSKIEQHNGLVMHAMKSSSIGYQGFGEAYFSTIDHQKTKGWKLHRKMTLNIIVPCGDIRFVVHCGKKCGDDFGIHPAIDVVLGNSNYQRLTVPPGYWLAFQGVGTSINMLMNVADIEHDPNEAINENLNYFNVIGFDPVG